MPGIDAKRLLNALLADPADAGAPQDATAALARDLTTAYVSEVLCPARARHRAYALLEVQPQSLWDSLAQMVFDSWQRLAPAARSLGTERLMRFESALGTIDVQLGRDALDESIQIAVAVESEAVSMNAAAIEAHVLVDGASAGTSRIALDGEGTGSARLSKQVSTKGKDIVVVVRDEMGEVLRTPAISTR